MAGEPHLYKGFESGPLFLLESQELDARLGRHGLLPVTPTRTVSRPTERGRWVTVNALYRKAPVPAPEKTDG